MRSDAEVRIQDDLNVISDRISTTVRSVSLGVLALAWLFIAGSKDANGLISLANYRWQLIAVAAICVIALLFDLAQYFFGYKCSFNALLEEEAAEDEEKPKAPKSRPQREKTYDFTEIYHVGRRAFFWAKQVAAGIGTFWMLGLIFVAVLNSSSAHVDKKVLTLDVSELSKLVGSVNRSNGVSVQPGRYQLFQGWYRFIDLKGEEHRTETLFKSTRRRARFLSAVLSSSYRTARARRRRPACPWRAICLW